MKILIPLLTLACLLLACSESNSVITRQEIDREDLALMRQEILALIADLSCSESSECAQIGFGSKPCGGPWEYLVYAAPNVNETLLQEKVAAYGAAEGGYNRENGIISDCALAPRADPTCVDQACVDLRGNP